MSVGVGFVGVGLSVSGVLSHEAVNVFGLDNRGILHIGLLVFQVAHTNIDRDLCCLQRNQAHQDTCQELHVPSCTETRTVHLRDVHCLYMNFH